MTRIEKLQSFLETGASVTAKQISARFGLKNPHEAVRSLRASGVCVYSNPAKLSDGREVTKYRIGKPSRAMVAAAAASAGATLFA